MARDPLAEVDRDLAEDGGEEGLDLDMLKDALGFVWRAPRRRPMLATAAFVLVAALGLTIAWTMPRTYNAQVKLLAQRNVVLSGPNDPRPDPARNVAGSIMRNDNLIALVHEANLIERFYAVRPAPLLLKDKIVQLFTGPVTEADRLRGMVGTLEKRLIVTFDDTSVTISVDWNDAEMAYELVSLVQHNFVEGRYDSEVAMIQDTISVLQEHAKTELEQVDSALASYQLAQAGRGSTAAAQAASANVSRVTAAAVEMPGLAPRPSATAALPDPDLAKALDDKRRRIRALEDEHQREIDTLRQQLIQAQLTLTPMHPTVIGLQRRLEALNEPTPGLAELRSEERVLMAQIAPVVPGAASSTVPVTRFVAAGGGGGVAAPTNAAAAAQQAQDARDDPALAPSRETLQSTIREYQNVMARIDAAKLELDFQRTAVRYRYSVLTPAEVPRSPKRPIVPLVAIGSVLGAVIAALLGSAVADWRTGRVLETWQVRRRLKLDVLAEFEPPA